MGILTRFTEISASFRLCDAQLRVALSQGDSIRRPAALLRLTARLMEQISNHEPASVAELDEMIDFFAARRLGQSGNGRSEFDRVADRLTRYGDAGPPDRADLSTRRSAVPDPLPDVMEGRDLARMITSSAGRLSAVSLDKRYLAVSAAEASHHRSLPEQMAGKHLLEVIGCGHLQVRQKQRLDLAMSGRAQDYVYTPSDSGGDGALIRCRCKAIRDGSDLVYAAIMHTTDAGQSDARGSEVA